MDEHDDVVDHRWVARLDFGLLDPVVFLEARIDDIQLIIDHAFGRNRVGSLAHVEDLVGLRDAPAFGKVSRGWEVSRISPRATVFNPAVDQLDLFGIERRIVLEVAMLGRRQPGRHPAVVDHFPHHFGPSHHLVVTGQSKRSDLTLVMTFDTTILQNASDLVRIRHVARRGRPLHATDQASGDGSGRLAHRLVGQQFLQCRFQVVALRRGLLKSDAKPVVNASPILHAAVLVQDEYFGRPDGAKTIGDFVARIFQDRKPNSVALSVGRYFRDRVLVIRVDAHESHALRLISGRQLSQTRRVESGQRALGAQERDDDQF